VLSSTGFSCATVLFLTASATFGTT